MCVRVKLSLLKTVLCERQEHPSNKRKFKFYHVVGQGFELNWGVAERLYFCKKKKKKKTF